MKIFDYFYLTLVRFQVRTLKKDPDDAQMSISFLVAFWLGLLIIAIICALGLLKRNWVADMVVNSELFLALVIGVGLIISLLRYYRFVKYPDLEEWRAGMSVLKRRIMFTLFLILKIGTPILSFITFRLYRYGYVIE